ncbi:Dihydrofolate reductase [Penicillium sp. IBT 16267x]|nr:Dihydrofolate reductase [Penicillium sp. IBT 16267x]
MLPPKTAHSIPPSLPLTLIVATTPIRVASSHPATPDHESTSATRLGIGLKGTLPWPRIKADMSFFARVTSRPPTPGTTNAIIMGRKTYDSVPKSLRPLAKRISVIITRDTSGSVGEGVLQELEARKAKMAAKAAESAAATGIAPAEEPITDAIVTPSLDAALSELDSVYGVEGRLGKIFVIGGAEIYGAALRMNFGALARPVRVVMTNVVRKPEGPDGAEVPYECDTFWPLDSMDQRNGWRSASPEELTEWVGEEVTGEWKREGEVEVQMVGFEKLD